MRRRRWTSCATTQKTKGDVQVTHKQEALPPVTTREWYTIPQAAEKLRLPEEDIHRMLGTAILDGAATWLDSDGTWRLHRSAVEVIARRLRIS